MRLDGSMNLKKRDQAIQSISKSKSTSSSQSTISSSSIVDHDPVRVILMSLHAGGVGEKMKEDLVILLIFIDFI